jgi:hypothetical protein
LLRNKFVNIFFKDLKYKTLVSVSGDWKKKNILIINKQKETDKNSYKNVQWIFKTLEHKNNKIKEWASVLNMHLTKNYTWWIISTSFAIWKIQIKQWHTTMYLLESQISQNLRWLGSIPTSRSSHALMKGFKMVNQHWKPF